MAGPTGRTEVPSWQLGLAWPVGSKTDSLAVCQSDLTGRHQLRKRSESGFWWGPPLPMPGPDGISWVSPVQYPCKDVAGNAPDWLKVPAHATYPGMSGQGRWEMAQCPCCLWLSTFRAWRV